MPQSASVTVRPSLRKSYTPIECCNLQYFLIANLLLLPVIHSMLAADYHVAIGVGTAASVLFHAAYYSTINNIVYIGYSMMYRNNSDMVTNLYHIITIVGFILGHFFINLLAHQQNGATITASAADNHRLLTINFVIGIVFNLVVLPVLLLLKQLDLVLS